MINPWTVLGTLRQITALDDEGAASALPLCSSAAAEIENRLKDSEYENQTSVIEAAAGIAYHKMMLLRVANEGVTTSFSAGDISVTQNTDKTLEIAARIRDDALRNAAQYLKDDSFVFRQVGV